MVMPYQSVRTAVGSRGVWSDAAPSDLYVDLLDKAEGHLIPKSVRLPSRLV